MRSYGRQPIKPDEPSFSQLILPVEMDQQEGDQERDEGSYDGTRDYQTGTREFLQLANDEIEDADDTAPADAIEVLEVNPPAAKDDKGPGKQDTEEHRNSRGKSQRPSKEK